MKVRCRAREEGYKVQACNSSPACDIYFMLGGNGTGRMRIFRCGWDDALGCVEWVAGRTFVGLDGRVERGASDGGLCGDERDLYQCGWEGVAGGWYVAGYIELVYKRGGDTNSTVLGRCGAGRG